MGRPRRRTGYLAGTFPPPAIVSNQHQGQRRLSSSQLLQQQSPLPQFTIPIRQPISQVESQYGAFPNVEPPYTPSTTEAISPVTSRATLSPGSTSAASSYTVALEHVRHMSPEAATPTSSTASVSRRQCLHRSDDANEQFLYPTDFRLENPPAPEYPMTEGLLGIESRALLHETSHHLYQSPQFITAQDPSPTENQRYPGTTGPWSTYPLRCEDQYINMEEGPPISMEFVQGTSRSLQGREKGGGRIGPLSQVQRQQASDVRKRGACLRCTIMREKCDCGYPCTTCKTKERRKCPKNCIPKDWDWGARRTSLFPDELTCRLRNDNLLKHLASSSFILSHRPQFTIPLDLHINIPLYVVVKEFCPLQSALEVRHAFQTFSDSNGTRSYGRQWYWNPPIVMLIGKGKSDEIIARVQKNICDIFEQLLDDPVKYRAWTTEYFEDPEEDFQTSILGHLGTYYRKDIKEHAILKTALRLLWFEYLLLNKFTIPPEAVGNLEAHLESKRPVGAHKDIQVIPETINRFLKAIILPMAEKAAEQLTKNLHDMLFKMAVTQKLSKANADLALCLLFSLMIFLGRTHNALLILAHIPAAEIGEVYTTAAAEAKIRDMEDKVSDYFLDFHKYTLSRKSSRSAMNSTDANSPFERHAREFGLIERLHKEIEEEYECERPTSLKVGGFQVNTFRYMNVRRLCWKVFRNVEDSC
ncbi:hypothetical protein, variant [Phialophora macrospora]|uniref:Zn(2)-C6 fungal-type domain-containing protein n=1 Tax=Phialophora macrospora TaxID=1851006 RepID=A0A0D2FVC4_9EURO|nr:hypothetical protein, variant [Phialophora macrospora]